MPSLCEIFNRTEQMGCPNCVSYNFFFFFDLACFDLACLILRTKFFRSRLNMSIILFQLLDYTSCSCGNLVIFTKI